MGNMNTKKPSACIMLFVSWVVSAVVLILICASSVNGYNSAIKDTYPVVVYEQNEVIESLIEEQSVDDVSREIDEDAVGRMERYREKLTAQKKTMVCWIIGVSIYTVIGCVIFFCLRDSHKKQKLFTAFLVFNILLFACFLVFLSHPLSR